MAWYRAGGGGIPSSLKTGMNSVLNKKFGTSTTYDPAGWPDEVNLLGPLPEGTASGSIAHITDGADTVPLKSWKVEIAPTLTGKSAVECTQTGANLVNGVSGYTVLANATEQKLIGSCEMVANVAYTLSCSMTGTPTQRNRNRWAVAKSSNMWDGTAVFGNDFYTAPQQTFTPSESGTYYFFIWSQGIDVDVSYDDFMCEVGSSASAFENYTAPVVNTVSLGRTICGGTADVVNGTGREDRLKYELDETDSWGAYSGTTHSFWHNVATGENRPIKQTEVTTSICNELAYSSNTPATAPDFSFCIQGGQRIVVTADSTIDTVDKFKTWLSSHNLVFVCPATTPTDFTFTPITPTPETKLGVNNFWADEGDSSVTYRADIDLLLGGN